MGVHESQSLLWERMIALGRPFSRYLAPKLSKAFPQLSNSLNPDTLYGGRPVFHSTPLHLTYSLAVSLLPQHVAPV